MAKQPIRVRIFNQTYTLLADGDEPEIQALADEIDQLMTSIAGRASSGDSTRIAVMACLHLADKARTAEKKLRTYQDKSGRIAEMLETALLEG